MKYFILLSIFYLVHCHNKDSVTLSQIIECDETFLIYVDEYNSIEIKSDDIFDCSIMNGRTYSNRNEYNFNTCDESTTFIIKKSDYNPNCNDPFDTFTIYYTIYDISTMCHIQNISMASIIVFALISPFVCVGIIVPIAIICCVNNNDPEDCDEENKKLIEMSNRVLYSQ